MEFGSRLTENLNIRLDGRPGLESGSFDWSQRQEWTDSQLDLNTMAVPSVPSSQVPSRPIPSQFVPIPEEDSFDQGRVHPAAQFGAVPPTDGAGGSQPANRRRQSTGNVTKVIRKQWESSQVEALLECKKAEAEELESLVGREQIISAEMKWKRIHAAMLAKGVQADPSQLRNKWESTLGSYKKVKDWNNRSGVEPYASLSRADRKANNLPLEFPDRWLDILESFYAGRPSITPPCMAESMPGSSGVDPPASSPGAPAEDDRYYSSTDPTVRSNSGKRRKKDASKSANAIVDCLDRFTNSMSEAETKRQDREAKRDEFEERHLQLMEDSDRRRVEFMQKQHSDMVEVFRSMAGAFDDAVKWGIPKYTFISSGCYTGLYLIQGENIVEEDRRRLLLMMATVILTVDWWLRSQVQAEMPLMLEEGLSIREAIGDIWQKAIAVATALTALETRREDPAPRQPVFGGLNGLRPGDYGEEVRRALAENLCLQE
ncbi:hypothetical protein R1sor_021172 [Riccia sorocarpa]|uniref:Myb/SANT-like DNA-binding domain-containing protein n=1 Tax=Riccia sorocarpa TaxID=122646 RepID=A0ABD3GHT0_9MARC